MGHDPRILKQPSLHGSLDCGAHPVVFAWDCARLCPLSVQTSTHHARHIAY